MIGAIDFIRKAKAICNARDFYCGSNCDEGKCPVYGLCQENLVQMDEAELVSKVMAYPIKDTTQSPKYD